jgi:hypothetical protein
MLQRRAWEGQPHDRVPATDAKQFLILECRDRPLSSSGSAVAQRRYHERSGEHSDKRNTYTARSELDWSAFDKCMVMR